MSGAGDQGSSQFGQSMGQGYGAGQSSGQNPGQSETLPVQSLYSGRDLSTNTAVAEVAMAASTSSGVHISVMA